ncbi:S-layer homology domain-containing protein [Selenomonas ruminantium]|uniref:S-layer homology domain-containing protein n=1 Tax=Selenomonas ruminantium TaxID=971 RepID=UPI001569EF67|nr:S-layer homology domain-containing protein [Selenomonas ruminantium]
MKKTLVSALTTALVVGAASTTFAAANPFSDVPADHWAYDAVSQLAADGVIEGYGDTTFKGNRNITRYEMAQMVAKAMAKSTSGVDKALVDKLAAEFAEELNNLGVRVANLERNADMVKWTGKAEYTYTHDKYKGQDGARDRSEQEGTFLFRLEPTAEVNSNWHVKARLDAKTYAGSDSSQDNSAKVELKRIWAQGDYDKFQVKIGRFAQINNGTFADTQFSGVELSYGKEVKGIVGVGRINKDSLLSGSEQLLRKSGSYQYVGVGYNKGKFDGMLSWHHVKAHDGAFGSVVDENHVGYKNDGSTNDQLNILGVEAAYQFSKNVGVNGFYSYNKNADIQKKAARLEVDYKGAQKENKGTWGAWLAYSHLGQNAMIANPWDATKPREKGWEIGANYTPFKNIVTTVRYGKDKKIQGGQKVDRFFGRVEFFF